MFSNDGWKQLGIMAVLWALGAQAPAIAQDPLADVEIKVIPIAEGLHMLMGAGGNIAVSSGEDGVFLVDDEYAPLTGKVRSAVSSISDADIRFVLNTHWHPDHSGGNENLGKGGTLIVAHDNARASLSVDHVFPLFDSEVKAAPKEALPVVTFNDEVTFHLNGDQIHAEKVPAAHTDGDVIVRFKKANVVHMGDIFMSGMFPFIDTSSGGSFTGMIVAVESTLETFDSRTKIIPGHGPLADKADVARYVAMLEEAHAKLDALLDMGKSEAEVLQANPLGDLGEEWGSGPIDTETFTKVAYQSLRAERSH